MKPFIVFAKTASFTREEIVRCQTAQGPHSHRVLLLSDRELEPYFVYERTEEEFEIRPSAISFEDLARSTKVSISTLDPSNRQRRDRISRNPLILVYNWTISNSSNIAAETSEALHGT